MLRRLTTREVVFVAMLLAIFMVSVEATIVATAMPTIVADLGGLRLFSWVFGAYVLTQAVTIPIYGRLADFFGRKPLLIGAIVLFLLGSTLCGFAHSMIALILFRALQGLGARGVQPIAVTTVGDLYQGRERARVQGVLSSMWALSAIAGPLLGAFVVQHVGWPVIFWINIPFGVACVIVVSCVLHERRERIAHRIDYAGSALLAAGIGTLMFVLVMAGNLPAQTSTLLAIVSAVALIALIVHEVRTAEPMIPFSLYRIRVIAVANAGNFFMGAIMIGTSAFIPTFVQGAMGRSAVTAGTVMSAIFVTWVIGSIGGAQMQLRTTYRRTAVLGGVTVVAGAAFLAALHADSNIIPAYTGVALFGIGFGLINSVFVISAQSAVGWELRGAATSSYIFQRQIGQAVGTAALGAVFNLGIYSRIPDAGVAVAALMDPVKRALLAPDAIAHDIAAVADASHEVFAIMLVLALLECALLFALPAKMRPPHAAPAAAQGAGGS